MTQYEGNIDTTGVTGYPGPMPLGTAHIASDKDTTSDGNGAGRFGGGPYAEPAPAGNPDTTQTNGAGIVTDPVSTDITGTYDTLNGGINLVAPAYKAPTPYVPAGTIDTTGTDVTGVGYDVDRVGPVQWIYMTQETYTIGAGAPGQAGSQVVTLTTSGVALPQTGIYRDSIIVKTDEGWTESVGEDFAISTYGTKLYYPGVIDGTLTLSTIDPQVVDGNEDVTLNGTTPVPLTQQGIITDPADVVVTYNGDALAVDVDYTITVSEGTYALAWIEGGALPTGTEVVNAAYQYQSDGTPLVAGTDYTLDTQGLEENRIFVVTLLPTSTVVQEGDVVRATYNVGTTSYFRPVTLAENIDYSIERSGPLGEVTTTLKRLESSKTLSGDTDVTVEYLYGSLQYYNQRQPQSVPDAPTGVVAYAGNHVVDVQWLPPAAGEEPDGYLIQSSTDGLVYVGASETRAMIHFLEADRHHNEADSEDPNIVPDGKFGTYKDYKFRVAAVNSIGRGPFSDWTTPSISPFNYDAVAPHTIPLENRINPIYRADGTIVPGTGLGV